MIGNQIEIKPGHYWFHESMPPWMGSAFRITLPTRFKVIEDRGGHWVVSNEEPVKTEPKVFWEGQMKLLVPKEEAQNE